MEQPPRFRWSVDDYHRLIDLGVLTKYHKVELIRGEIVAKMPKGDLHPACMKRLTRHFYTLAGHLATMSVQDPIVLADSEPEPDFALLLPRADDYRNGKPRPADVYLVIEVADSSLNYDRDVKAPLYAENGIAEYWIVNLIDGCLEVPRGPQPDGTYQDKHTLKPGDSIALALLPAVSVAVGDIIP